MQFTVNVLGCGSAVPTLRHQPASQVIDHRDRLFMVDCGEGAQLQMRRMKLKFSRVNHIFLSHLHGDHFLGLPGLLSTMALHEKGSAVTVYTFKEGAEIIGSMLRFICGDTPFDLRFRILTPGSREVIYEDQSLSVSCFPLYHRVPALGFIFREKPKPLTVNGDMVKFHQVPHYMIPSIRSGADFVSPDGTVVPNSHLTLPAPPAMSYAYCSDTMFDPRVAADVEGTDTIYHEATYGESEAHLARPRGHSTAAQAGTIARMAGARRLILGHFSKRYFDETPLVEQARAEFNGDVIAANEGMKINLL
ncbi:MAG: ribonuclease Z [Muribaculaceae bacterium]|nr:ribonuclease Z [Muribaculaceae bacterium]MDE6509805.1 ribonuclease Z [Muribaculaceae bacterium]